MSEALLDQVETLHDLESRLTPTDWNLLLSST